MGKVLLLIVRRGGMPETGRRTVRLRWCCVLSCRSVLLLPLLLLLEPPLGRAPKRRLCRRGLGVSWSGIAKLRLGRVRQAVSIAGCTSATLLLLLRVLRGRYCPRRSTSGSTAGDAVVRCCMLILGVVIFNDLHVKIILISCGHGEGSSCAGSSCAGKNDEKVLTRRCHVRPRLNDCWNTAQLTENC